MKGVLVSLFFPENYVDIWVICLLRSIGCVALENVWVKRVKIFVRQR